MKNVKMVYVNESLVLNLVGEGRLATLTDLNEDLCLGGDPVEGLVQIVDGIFNWIDLTFIDEDDFQGYIKVA